MCTYTLTYIYTYIHTYMHTYEQAYIDRGSSVNMKNLFVPELSDI